MNIDSISNGIVIDHITAGRGMELYELLGLGKLDCSVAIIKNAHSEKLGKKDIIKIDCEPGRDRVCGPGRQHQHHPRRQAG